VGHPDEGAQPAADGPDDLAVDTDRGSADPLHNRSHRRKVAAGSGVARDTGPP
jgi:hypothetical protein